MKLFYKLIIFIFFPTILFAQAPQGFSYQAVIRDGNGAPITNRDVALQFTLQNSSKISFYIERKTIKTTAQGVINHSIGTGQPTASSGAFASIPWSTGDIFIKVEIDPAGGANFVSMGVPVQLQSVPYALYANNTKEVVSQPNATDEDPIFVVRNKEGKIVFAVYQTGVRVYVEDTQSKGTKGGFAVGGLSGVGKGEIEYLRITPDSARIFVKESSGIKGTKGGFAVGGLSGQSKTVKTNDLMYVSNDSVRFYTDGSTSPKGTKGGFAVGGLSGVGKGSSGNYLDLTPQNSFIGQDAGKSNTTGKRNAFIGYQAGINNTIGEDNILIGNAAGLQNISGLNNIFLGTNSGKNNKTGVSNISIGTGAGENLNNGKKNIFIGVEAGNKNADGLDNVFIGNYAGSANIANSNVFIGRTSGMSNVTGTNNVFVGEQTGRSNVEGSGNVFIGDQAGINEYGSNKLYISNSSTSTPLIYGEFDNGKIDVNGAIKLRDILNLKPKTTYVGTPTEGDIFYDGNSHTIKYYNGTTWMELSATASASVPIVSTLNVTPLTFLSTSCTVNCNISNQGGSPIIQSGVRYNTTPFFDVNVGSTILTTTPEVGSFSISLSGLSQKRTYYARAFATNSQGTSLGNMITFTTPILTAMPTVTSNPVTNISQTSAVAGGNVTLPGGTSLTALGICWGTSSNPTTSSNTISAPVNLGSFSINLSGLTANTTYYVRAYAVNSNGTNYGNEVVFNTASLETSVADIDGNNYNTAQIGIQTWMKENLKTTKYRDGSNIDNITNIQTWSLKTTGAYCWYNNNISNKDVYGALYNYYAIVDSRNLCPSGWHVPTNDDWLTLSNYLGGEVVAGGKLKSTGSLYWSDPNSGADNSSGFTALPGGELYNDTPSSTIIFTGKGDNAFFWSSSEYNELYINTYLLEAFSPIFQSSLDERSAGLSVRCLKDK